MNLGEGGWITSTVDQKAPPPRLYVTRANRSTDSTTHVRALIMYLQTIEYIIL